MDMFGINTASQFAQSGVDSVTSKKMSEKAFEQNKYMQQQAFDNNVEMWELSNQYNLPINQMQRLRDAGINPHLAYAKGTINNVASSQLPKYQAAELKYNTNPIGLRTLPMLGDFMDLQKKQAETNITKEVAKQEAFKTAIANNTLQATIDKLINDSKASADKAESAKQRALYNAQAVEYMKSKKLIEQKKGELAEKYMFPGDNILYRIFSLMMGESGMAEIMDQMRDIQNDNLEDLPPIENPYK